jgi:hypothetical protein
MNVIPTTFINPRFFTALGGLQLQQRKRVLGVVKIPIFQGYPRIFFKINFHTQYPLTFNLPPPPPPPAPRGIFHSKG